MSEHRRFTAHEAHQHWRAAVEALDVAINALLKAGVHRGVVATTAAQHAAALLATAPPEMFVVNREQGFEALLHEMRRAFTLNRKPEEQRAERADDPGAALRGAWRWN